MTLGRLVVAWAVVVLWFAIATIATAVLVARSMPAPAGGDPVRARNRALTWRLIEAGVLTLVASLWFDSLGGGEWWLLFLLIGALVAFPAWFRSGSGEIPRRALVANSIADLVRYLIAGALLAWRLS